LSDTQYSFTSRFAEGKGTNPEELIAAAHAGCFSMALSNELGKAGLTPESLKTAAAAAGFTITAVHLDITARVPGASQRAFETATAKSGCPVSKVLKAEITVNAKLES
jgi:lipoyl-dependent peroxiredoxin